MRIIMNIKTLRQDRKISLSTLQMKSGVSTSHINEIENNNKMPSLIIMIKLAKALGVTISDLYKIEYWVKIG